MPEDKRVKKAIGLESICFSILFIGFFALIGYKMGIVHMFSTMMKAAYYLLINTVFFIMAIAVLAGALGGLLSEFGATAIINKILSPLMKPLYDLPGAAAIGIVTTYLSDNPAIITLTQDKGFKRYFKKYQIPALTNLGTAFGMGLIVTTFMMAQKASSGQNFIKAALIGDLGAIVGSIVSVRIMLIKTKKVYGTNEMAEADGKVNEYILNYREIRRGSIGRRMLEAILEGGKSGVDMGLSVIPGIIVICTLVFMLTNGSGPHGCYTGAYNEGVPVLPWIGKQLSFIINPLLGFKNAEAVAFPITSLGSAGAALGLVPSLLEKGLIGANDIAVFTAMGMCWSGYLSTHVAMMDALNCRKVTGHAILSHTIGGLAAGIAAHFIFLLLG